MENFGNFELGGHAGNFPDGNSGNPAVEGDETFALLRSRQVGYGRGCTIRWLGMLNDLKTQLGDSVASVRRLFQRPGAASAAGSAAPVTRDARHQAREEHHRRVRLMRRELYLLLEQHPTSRDLMRHLALVERTLRLDGFSAVKALPPRVIAKALAQLEQLVWDWTPEGLAELRSRLAVLVKAQTAGAPAASETEPAVMPRAEHARYAQSELGHAMVGDATEIDHAAFEEMERSWSGQMPAAVRSALAPSR